MSNGAWADALQNFAGDGPIYVAGCCGEPTSFLDSMEDDPDIARGRTLTGVWIPGVNRRDPTRTGNRKALSSFVTPALQEAVASGRAGVLPMHYSTTYRWLARKARLAGAVFQVSAPRNGSVSLGVAADFTPSIVASKVPLVAQINTAMPQVMNGPTVPIDRIAALVEADTPLIVYDAGPIDEAHKTIGLHVANLVRDGDTVQFGLGKLQNAILAALSDHRSLALHGGMISPAVLKRLSGGTFESATTGVALGDRAFYRAAAHDKRIAFRPVSITHDAKVLAEIRSFVSVNSVLEVDLYGQGNGEFLGDVQITGHGGMADFMRGAALSDQGRSILALPATARRGSQSRIVPTLNVRAPVTINRADIDWVVTEYGAASLRYATVEQRAERLIGIAAPQFRNQLSSSWESARRKDIEA